jgi:anti-anti-sigma regulatory factor
MLRITIDDKPRAIRLRLEGKLAGPWVREVERSWQLVQATAPPKPVTIDLREVDFVDAAGEQALATMYEHGARLLATRPLTKSVVSKITGEPEETGANLLPS